MPLNVMHFRHEGRAQWGVVRNGLITPIPGDFATTADFISSNPIHRLAALEGPLSREAEDELLSPITRNQQYDCEGANYRQHLTESGMDPDIKAYNLILQKTPACTLPA